MTDSLHIDTICFVLPESATDTTESLIAEWSAMGYFHDAPWTHPEMPYRQKGFSGTPLPYSPGNDAGLNALAFFCIILFVLTLRDVKDTFRQATKPFFLLSARQSDTDDRNTDRKKGKKKKDRRARSAFAMGALVCLLGGAGVFAYFCAEGKVRADGISPYVYTGVYAGLLAGYMLFRLCACRFVHWVFFGEPQTKVWVKTNYYITVLEGLLCVPALTLTLFGSIPARTATLYLLAAVCLCKLLSFYNTFRIFFRKVHGLLHLFVYLCTLELTPLLALARALVYVTLGLTIKN